MTLKLITAATTWPVTRAEAKNQCRIDADLTADDARIDMLIEAATMAAEHELGDRALMTQTWERVLDEFPCVAIELGKQPVSSIVSVKYIDATEVEQTLSSASYSHDTDTDEGLWLLPAIGTSWPSTLDTANAVRVRFECGYGAAEDVPAAIKTWILLQIEHAYVRKQPPEWVDRLIDRYRVYA
jgi:uncharacterized phiE125 gp8 family phage protein